LTVRVFQSFGDIWECPHNMSPNVPNIIVPRQLVLELHSLLRVGTGEDSVMDEIVFRHGEDEFRERFEVKEQIGVGGK